MADMFPEDDYSVYYMILLLFVRNVVAPGFYDTYFDMGTSGTVSIAMQSAVALCQHVTQWLTWQPIRRRMERRWNATPTLHLDRSRREEIERTRDLALLTTEVVSGADFPPTLLALQSAVHG